MARIIGSWFPSFVRTRFMAFLMQMVDPYLNIFKRLIPPIGGMLDLSPILAFLGLEILKTFILYLII
ncbi:MAG: YggT family protein [Verrucomicrobia bacterium]|nr:YggT family protein [Verrucomicrobiota bacterium]